MEEYVAVIVFLMPGFIVTKIHELLGNKRKYDSNIRTVTEIIGYDLVIFAIQILILKWQGLVNINEVLNKIAEFSFLVKLTTNLVVTSIIIGIIIALIHPKYTDIIVNKIRNKLKKPPINNNSVWDLIINRGPCYLEIKKEDNVVCRGTISVANFSANEERELLLSNSDLLDKRPDLFDELTAETYYNIDKDLVIKVYDPAKLIAESESNSQNNN